MKIADALGIDVVPLLVATGVIPPSRRVANRSVSVDDRHALAERIAKLERRMERDRVELADIRQALLQQPPD